MRNIQGEYKVFLVALGLLAMAYLIVIALTAPSKECVSFSNSGSAWDVICNQYQ